jgi:hypothetical protein
MGRHTVDYFPVGEPPIKVVFLDIDGVLQMNRQDRFEHVDPESVAKLNAELHEKFGGDYTAYSRFDVAATYYDWEKPYVENLHKILSETGAKIVLSSSWRNNGHQQMFDLFRIYGLDKYYYDDTVPEYPRPEVDYKKELGLPERGEDDPYIDRRAVEILLYLRDHQSITHFVALDDFNLKGGLGECAVQTWGLTDEFTAQAIEVLGKPGRPLLPEKIKPLVNR